jgi:hypothetical protein
MNQRQRDLRRAAAQAFIKSLDTLPETLCSLETEPEIVVSGPNCALANFEKAVADIEQFMEAQQDTSANSDHLM